jgi:hypothetical protein
MDFLKVAGRRPTIKEFLVTPLIIIDLGIFSTSEISLQSLFHLRFYHDGHLSLLRSHFPFFILNIFNTDKFFLKIVKEFHSLAANDKKKTNLLSCCDRTKRNIKLFQLQSLIRQRKQKRKVHICIDQAINY